MKSRPCSRPATSSSMPAGARFAVRIAMFRSPGARSCSLWSAPSQRPGRPTFRAISSSSARFKRASPTSRTGPGSVSSSAGCAPPCARLRVSRRPRAASCSPRSTLPPSSCWPRRLTDPPARSSLYSRAASRGQRLRSRGRSARASEPSSARCTSSKKRRRCAPSDAVAPAAGSRRRSAGFATTLLLPGALPRGSLGS